MPPYGILFCMSHSYKRYSIVKFNDQYYKRLVHKRGRHLIDVSPRQYKHCVNDYDICDYCWFVYESEYTTADDVKRWTRK